MDRKKETIKEQNHFRLTKIAIAIFGIICTVLGVWGLFGLTKVHLPQTKVEGTVVSITLKTIPNSNKHSFIYTFEYVADDGETRQFEAVYKNNKYLPFETVKIWYFNESMEANASYETGWITFGVFTPIGIILILVDIFAIKKQRQFK